jgi:prepilin-type N-terminal cleavage/methylation domain-containing protein
MTAGTLGPDALRPTRRSSAPKGYSLVELLAALAIVAIAVAVTLPAAAQLRDAGRAAAGARTMATRLSALRWKSTAGGRSTGFQFRRVGSGWTWREVVDGNGNGLRAAEIARGVDEVAGEVETLERSVPHVTFGFPPEGVYPEAPPGTDLLRAGDDPVRFGVSDIVSFSPLGASSSGTLYVTDGRRGLFAIVLFGPTTRLRVWRWDQEARRWTL